VPGRTGDILGNIDIDTISETHDIYRYIENRYIGIPIYRFSVYRFPIYRFIDTISQGKYRYIASRE